jgi:hypothetical protein
MLPARHVACTPCALKIKAAGYPETPVNSYHTTRRHIIVTYLLRTLHFTKLNLASLWGLLIGSSEACDVVMTHLFERCKLYSDSLL